jgi:hypothetical protein
MLTTKNSIPTTRIPWILLAILIAGCDDRVTQVAREAADRQAQQNTTMAELNKEVATGTQELVAADAQARQAIVGVHHDLQIERQRLDLAWSDIEQERQQLAGQRRTESLLVPALQSGGLVAVVVVLLGFAWRALVAVHTVDDTETQLNELLIRELLPDDQARVSGGQGWPTLSGESGQPKRLR